MQQRDISGYNGIYQRNKDLRRRDSARSGFREVFVHALYIIPVITVNGTNGYHLTILKNDTALLTINSWLNIPLSIGLFWMFPYHWNMDSELNNDNHFLSSSRSGCVTSEFDRKFKVSSKSNLYNFL